MTNVLTVALLASWRPPPALSEYRRDTARRLAVCGSGRGIYNAVARGRRQSRDTRTRIKASNIYLKTNRYVQTY